MGMRHIPLTRVQVTDDFWSPRQKLMTDVTIPFMEKILRDEVPGAEKSHAIDNFRMAAGEMTGDFYGMVFQDSDVAKWLEAAAYSLWLKEDEALSERVDEIVSLIGRCQQPDGYLNTYFTVKEPGNQWKNLLECHELYCAGHMLEAGAALKEAAGKDELLQICVRLADHICDRFETQEGIPGHQEVEIGLLRMYRVTGNPRYRDMALRFLDRRGQDPNWFAEHTPPHPGVHYGGYDISPDDTVYNQSDVPVRDQTAARGHAVRQLYMLTAMADAAAETGDRALREACERLFENITQRQMYVTGAVGASAFHESFTHDFDLPSGRCYGETCAAVAMTFFARAMLGLQADGRYADLMERELYNGALAGMQLNGTRFFYVNPLSVDLRVSGTAPGYRHVLPRRPRWHACACCPPNLARLIASLGGYLWSEDGDTVYSHLFIGSEVRTSHGCIRVRSAWPWEGNVTYTVLDGSAFTLAFRVPGYVKEFSVSVNGRPWEGRAEKGYFRVSRAWRPGDTVVFRCGLPVRRVYADPRVKDCAGRTALARGPLVYCLEAADQSVPVFSLSLPRAAEVTPFGPVDGLPQEIVGLKMEARTMGKNTFGEAQGNGTGAPDEALDPGASGSGTVPDDPAPGSPPAHRCLVTAIPYYAWANRAEGDMTVWIPEC